MGTLVAVLTVVPARAQIRQYTPPGGAANEAGGRKAPLEAAVEGARWNLGSIRLDPAFWISDLSYADSSQENTDAELTARAGAGLRAYLPIGSKTTLAVVPEPASAALLAGGMALLAGWRRRKTPTPDAGN